MRELGTARSARETGRFAQQRAVKTMKRSIGNQELYRHLKTYGRAEIDDWTISAGDAEIQFMNPYGIGVGFYTNNAEGCAGILGRTSTDGRKRERGTLQCSHSELKATDARHGTGVVA